MKIELSGDLVAQSRVIARGERIRDVQRLIDQYGGRRSKWLKKSSPAFELGKKMCEYHWYEHQEIGRVEIKMKVLEKP